MTASFLGLPVVVVDKYSTKFTEPVDCRIEKILKGEFGDVFRFDSSELPKHLNLDSDSGAGHVWFRRELLQESVSTLRRCCHGRGRAGGLQEGHRVSMGDGVAGHGRALAGSR